MRASHCMWHIPNGDGTGSWRSDVDDHRITSPYIAFNWWASIPRIGIRCTYGRYSDCILNTLSSISKLLSTRFINLRPALGSCGATPQLNTCSARNHCQYGFRGWLPLVRRQCTFEIANVHSRLARLDRSHRTSRYLAFLWQSTASFCIYQLRLHLGHVYKFQSFCVRCLS